LKPINIAIFDDNNAFRNSLSIYIISDNRFVFLADYPNALNIASNLNALSIVPEVVLMDIDMPGKTGIEGVKEIKNLYPNCNVLMLTSFEDEKNIFDAICAGASGYLLKRTQPDDILQACIDSVNGGAPITPIIAKKVLAAFQSITTSSNNNIENLTLKEKEVLSSLVNGNSYKMIANHLNMSIDTVRSHIKKIYAKLHVNSMNEAVAKAIKHGLT
jgi:DNA-binding NarL/FixJ family response regulator